MKREDLLGKKMVVGDLDGDSVVKFLKKYGIEYYNIQECKTNWISINKNGEVAYYLRENGYNQCAYPEIDLGNIIYQDKMSNLMSHPNQPKPAKEQLIDSNKACDCTIEVELYIDGRKYASIELHETKDIVRWMEAEKLPDLFEEEVKNNNNIIDYISCCAHEIFSRQLEKQQEDIARAAIDKFARYEKVLVRADTKQPWLGHIFVTKNGPYYECANGGKYLYCIPFDPEKLGRVTND